MPEADPSVVVLTAARTVRHILEQLRKSRRRQQYYARLIQLILRLETWIDSEYTPSHPRSHTDEIEKFREALSLLEDLASFASQLKEPTNILNLRRRLSSKDAKRYFIRLEACLDRLTRDSVPPCTVTSSATSSITNYISPGDLLLSLDNSPQSGSNRKLNTAITFAKFVKEGVTPVPVAGGILSTGFSLVVMILEKRKEANNREETLRNMRRQIRSIVECLYDLRILTRDPNGGILVNKNTSTIVQSKVQELVILVNEVKLLSCGNRQKSGSVNPESLLARIAEYQSFAMPVILSQHLSQDCAKQNHHLFIAIAASSGFFFYSVRK